MASFSAVSASTPIKGSIFLSRSVFFQRPSPANSVFRTVKIIFSCFLMMSAPSRLSAPQVRSIAAFLCLAMGGLSPRTNRAEKYRWRTISTSAWYCFIVQKTGKIPLGPVKNRFQRRGKAEIINRGSHHQIVAGPQQMINLVKVRINASFFVFAETAAQTGSDFLMISLHHSPFRFFWKRF